MNDYLYIPLIVNKWDSLITKEGLNGIPLTFIFSADLGSGFIPVYKSSEEANKFYPNHQILKLEILESNL